MNRDEPIAHGPDDRELEKAGHGTSAPATAHSEDLADDSDPAPGDTSEIAEWRYAQKMRRGRTRTYYGVVNYARGAHADRLRCEQSAAIIALLEWAASRTGNSSPDADPDTFDREDDAA